jgi:hypothetical protein
MPPLVLTVDDCRAAHSWFSAAGVEARRSRSAASAASTPASGILPATVGSWSRRVTGAEFSSIAPPRSQPSKADTMTDPVDAKIASLGDWRGALLSRIRQLMKEAVPDVVEEVKWRKPTNPLGVPTWSCAGIICTGESYRDKVKLTFAKGSSLSDPSGLFNASLTGVRRALDIREDDELDTTALQDLFRQAAALNATGVRR